MQMAATRRKEGEGGEGEGGGKTQEKREAVEPRKAHILRRKKIGPRHQMMYSMSALSRTLRWCMRILLRLDPTRPGAVPEKSWHPHQSVQKEKADGILMSRLRHCRYIFIATEKGGVARAKGGGEKEKECSTTECKSRRRRDEIG